VNEDGVERELKLVPADASLLDRLGAVERLGNFEVLGHRRELQRNSFFDSASRALGHAHVGFRRRTVQGQPRATWTVKGDSDQVGSVAIRSEIELQLDPETAPALALGALRDAARSRGAKPLAEAIGDAVASGGLPLARPFLETETDRRILDLGNTARSVSVELALDRMRLLGHDYADIEIEAELKRGEPAVLDEIRDAIAAFGPVEPSRASKLSRAMAHLETCHCPP
jgi:inorganic triphosphatase YgiF